MLFSTLFLSWVVLWYIKAFEAPRISAMFDRGYLRLLRSCEGLRLMYSHTAMWWSTTTKCVTGCASVARVSAALFIPSKPAFYCDLMQRLLITVEVLHRGPLHTGTVWYWYVLSVAEQWLVWIASLCAHVRVACCNMTRHALERMPSALETQTSWL